MIVDNLKTECEIYNNIFGCGCYTSGDDRNTIFKNPQVRVLGRSKFYNNMSSD